MSPALFASLVAALIVVTLLAGVAVAVLAMRTRGQQRLQRRLQPQVGPVDELVGQSPRPVLGTIVRSGKAIERLVDAENESARLLVQAGWRSTESRIAWYAFQALVPVALGGALVAFWLLGPDERKSTFLLLFGFAAFALSYLIPRWVLRGAAGARQRRLKNEVPLFIHLLVLLFEAGLSTRQAFASLVREGGGVLPQLGREFDLVLRQLEAGGDTADVLKALADALLVDDLSHILAVLRQVDRYGGEVREPLLEALAVLEQRRSLDMREKVNLMSGRMTVVMVLCFFPALLIFVAGPAFLAILKALADVGGR